MPKKSITRKTCKGYQMAKSHLKGLVISRKRKLYKFARFNEFENCFHLDEWIGNRDSTLKSFITANLNCDLIVEIGAGSALFLVELARQNPNNLFIAIDIKSDRLYRGAREASELKLKNIYFIRSDITRLTDIFPYHIVAEIWLTFPDPYANEDQTKLTSTGARKRLTASRFLQLYREILKENGIINFKTDNLPLFEWSLEQFTENNWKREFVTRDLHNIDANSGFLSETRIMTSYEKRFVDEGKKINYARFAV